MDLEEITLFEKLSQLEAYQDISNLTYIIPSSSVLSPLLNNKIHLFVRISIPQCYACTPILLFLSIQKSAIEHRSVTSRKCDFQNILILALDPEKALLNSH